MLAEVIPAAYDSNGKPTFQPRKRPFRFFAPNSPMGRYLTQPLKLQCTNLAEMRGFLAQCRYVSDQEQFGKRDYWMYPEQFEDRRQGDCDDFALWTWRQLLAMGYDARFVCGRAGLYGGGHAWVTFIESGRTFLIEPLAARLSGWLPRLMTVRYKPSISVGWDGRKLSYHEHQPKHYDPTLRELLPLIVEWLHFRVVTLPSYSLAWLRYFIKRGKSIVMADPRAWGRDVQVIVRRIPLLWSHRGRRSMRGQSAK